MIPYHSSESSSMGSKVRDLSFEENQPSYTQEQLVLGILTIVIEEERLERELVSLLNE